MRNVISVLLNLISFTFIKKLFNRLNNSYEEEEKWKEAVECYEKCLLVNPGHKEAKNSIDYVKTKIGMINAEHETIPLLPPAKAHGVKETLKQLLATQEKKKKKKKDKK